MKRTSVVIAVSWVCACARPGVETPPPLPPPEQPTQAPGKPPSSATPSPAASSGLLKVVREEPATPRESPVMKPEKKAESRGGTFGTLSGHAAQAFEGGAAGVGGLGTGAGGLVLRGSGSGGGAVSLGRGVIARAIGSGDAVSGESYGNAGVNEWTDTAVDHLSTFAADVDTASYAIARRKIREGALPPPTSVRVEEFLNYFRYSYPQPEGAPLSVTMDAAPSPFTRGRHLLRVGVQGRRLNVSERKPAHLTFLVDVSGSMQSADKLPLAKRALRLLVDNLRDGDTVALVTYAGNVRLVLPHTGMEHKAEIHEAIEALSAGGSTAMSSGIQLAYQQATRVLDGQSISRVIILSDGDANVGPTTHEENLRLIAGHVKEGVTVTTVGFGMGNYKDDLMEQFANKGNGNHAYVDSLMEAKKVFATELGGTLEVIAQDVKLQVDFDPAQVSRYRLVGYENRTVADRDFRNDAVDAGEIGSGHTVTALYEVELKPGAGERFCTVRVRAKKPRGTEAAESSFPFPKSALSERFDGASRDLRFAVAVMGAAELLRQSPHAREWNVDAVLEIARSTAGDDAERLEFVKLLQAVRPRLRSVASR